MSGNIDRSADFDLCLPRGPLAFIEGLGPHFEIKGDPVAWARPRFDGRRGFTAEKQRYAKELLQVELRRWWRGKAIEAPQALCVRIIFRFKARKKAEIGKFKHTKPDIDNLVKLVCDAANGIVWADDNQVAHLTAMKVFSEESGTFMAVECL